MTGLDLLYIIEIGMVCLVLLAIAAVDDYLRARLPGWMRRRADIKALRQDQKDRRLEIGL